MQDYIKNQRFTKIDRQRGGITAHKVLEVKGDNVIIGVPHVLSKDGSISVAMSDTSGIKPGTYLDFQFAYTISDGKANSYQARFLGETPLRFIPEEEI